MFHQVLSAYDVAAMRPRPLVLDIGMNIGMNIGWFTLYSRAHGHGVAAFEPNPTMFLRVWCVAFGMLPFHTVPLHPLVPALASSIYLRSKSLQHNHWSQEKDDIALWNYGLGATPGKFNLTLGNNPGGARRCP